MLHLVAHVPHDMSFHDATGKTIGTLDWGDGTLRFSGNAEESAGILFEHLKNLINAHLASRDQAEASNDNDGDK